MDETAYEKAYASLNDGQRRAVDTIEGPVMVIAGPGTGKTQILTLRIANILLSTDTKPENILALTFTESGATAMRDRLRRYIGTVAYRVPIYTFHGFADMLIRAYPDAYPRIIGGRPATELEKINIIESVIETSGVSFLRPSGNPSYYVKPILSMLATMKQEYITPDRLSEIIGVQESALAEIPMLHEKGAHKGKVRGEYMKKEKDLAKNRELLVVYRLYDAALRERMLYDFDDMIVDTVHALTTYSDMRLDLQERYQYILADEHQDVNGSQNSILEQLASFHDRPNIFVVGDEKQAIYRFQGASLENFLYFEDVFPHTTTIALTENYRSGQRILDAAHSLIAVPDGKLAALRVPLTAHREDESMLQVRAFAHQAIEDEWLVEAIKNQYAAGVVPSEIAVIVRTNREVESITRMLRAAGVDVVASADGDILTHAITEHVCTLIDAVAFPEREAALFALLHGAHWGISRSDLVRVLRARRFEMPLAHIIEDAAQLAELGLTSPASIERVATVLKTVRERSMYEAPQHVLAFLIKESGFLDHVLAHDPLESGRVIRRLYDEVEAMVRSGTVPTFTALALHFSKLREYHIALQAPYIATRAHAVRVMTAHKSKGLEFDHVYIPHLVDSTWGTSRNRTLFDVPLTRHNVSDLSDETDDERRLFYVALTRARNTISLSHAAHTSEGKELVPSRFLFEIDPAVLTNVPTEEVEDAFRPETGILPTVPHDLDPALFAHILSERGLSATSLNNYLSSPWNYVYRNALRIPEVQPEHMLFGTALHSVMQRVTRQYSATRVLASTTEVSGWLHDALSKLPLSVEGYTRRHEQGLLALTTYIHARHESFGIKTHEEVSFSVVMQTGIPEFPEVKLTGNLDRVDLGDAGTILSVTDYKTGKPKTRNHIEGKTKGSDGNYKRQLTFYALLLSLAYSDDPQKIALTEYVLSFLEPDSNGQIKEEVFSISPNEIEELKADIVRVVREIVSGEMLKAPVDETKTEYGHLVAILRGEAETS